MVTVTVTDVNERPDINENFDAPRNYMEIEYDFMGTGPDVHTFMAEDYDDMDTFTWSLLGADAGDLDIDPMSGVLTFTQNSGLNAGPLPNFEAPQDDSTGGSNTYNITVRATDKPHETNGLRRRHHRDGRQRGTGVRGDAHGIRHVQRERHH